MAIMMIIIILTEFQIYIICLGNIFLQYINNFLNYSFLMVPGRLFNKLGPIYDKVFYSILVFQKAT